MLKHAWFFSFVTRESSTFEDVLFVAKTYLLQEQFTEYQLLDESHETDIPRKVWNDAVIKLDGGNLTHRMDKI